MKKRRRIEVIGYSSRVTAIEGSDSVEKNATRVANLIEIVANEREDRSSADEMSSLATTVNADEEKRALGRVGPLRRLLRRKR